MRLLVTGAAGFVGSHVVDLAVAEGHEVVGLDALLPEAHGGALPAWSRTHRPEVGDIRDAGLLDRLLPGVDAVCHQAAMVGHGHDPSDAPAYASHNDYGTAVLLAAMYRAGVTRLVLASSMVVYGEGGYRCATHGAVRPAPRRPADLTAGRYEPTCPACHSPLTPTLVPEDAPLEPRSTYAASKLAQEHLAAAWARQTGGGVWALRYHNVYGPRMPRDTPYAGVAAIFRSALAAGRPPRVLEDGRQRRDFVHVTDVARANLLALAAPPPDGLVPVNVCSGQPHTVGELADTLAAAMGGPAPLVVGGARAADVRHVVADPRRAADLLGYTARVGFAEGVVAFAHDPLREPAARPAAGPPLPAPAVSAVSAEPTALPA
ncbi:NAD-dependent epimerase/dehydratase family protein [Micromonospora sp. WMMA1363]|uniref:NAD-dependent epimerase/dehydratase family protein n=1 Tax=Micromonospora sp. WMMA1363 TaxID=3053985 RepID=UPI00259C9D83|nr:NAD-dependent epimerase/dehydratase family protein [Micromonospora sp. WMMA1363]MDM4719240.1 NAD-dependent epimerase/dehydratase family protein [Micromonospora sp. WMMA1363]